MFRNLFDNKKEIISGLFKNKTIAKIEYYSNPQLFLSKNNFKIHLFKSITFHIYPL